MKKSQDIRLSVGYMLVVAAVGFGTSANAADADAAQATARQSSCFTCHAVDKDKIGSAWNKVAAKYKGNPEAEALLVKHLISGPKVKFPDGHEQPHMIIKSTDQDEIKNLVDWILSL